MTVKSTRGLNPGTVISQLPAPDDIDADYSPQYVKLARILRHKITSGALGRFKIVRARDLNEQYGVSARVACATLSMLAANGYVARAGNSRAYRVTWDVPVRGAER
jgi:DNA-binding GntR family transcriptional regulator